VKRLALLLSFVVGCAWSTFDDLSTTTPAHAQEKPDGVKASDYGVAITGATTATETSGGTLAVLSSGTGNYSTLKFDPGGATSLGDSESLGQHTIDSVTPNAFLLTDGMGNAAIVDNSNVGTLVAIHGPVNGLNVDTQISTSQKPDAAVFAGARLLIAAAPQMMGGPNFFNVAGGGVINCTLVDNAAMPLSAVGMAADATNLWVWSKAGAFFTYPLTAFDGMGTCTGLAPTSVLMPGMAANGGRVDILGHYAVLTAYDLPTTMTGQVTIVDVGNPSAPAIVGAPVLAHGVRSVAVDTFDGQGAVVLGYPNRTVDATSNAGAIDLHVLDLATGTLAASPAQTITIPQADQNLTFGRTLTTMHYNGKPIVVAAGTNVLYAYYATMLYTKR